jgi:hypothetical protein
LDGTLLTRRGRLKAGRGFGFAGELPPGIGSVVVPVTMGLAAEAVRV